MCSGRWWAHPFENCQYINDGVKQNEIYDVSWCIKETDGPLGAFPWVIWIWISGPRSFRSCCIEGTVESTLAKNSSVLMIYHDPSDLGSLILTHITRKERTIFRLN